MATATTPGTGTVLVFNNVTQSQVSSLFAKLDKTARENAVIIEMTPGPGGGSASLQVLDSADNGAYFACADSEGAIPSQTAYKKQLIVSVLDYIKAQITIVSGTWSVRITPIVATNSATLNATISGPMTANQGAQQTDANGWPVKLTDGTNGEAGIATDGAKKAVQVHITGTDVGASGGTSSADESAFTAGTSNFTPGGGVYNDGVAALTSGQQGERRLTPNRAGHVNLRTNGGVELPATATPAAGAGTGITDGLQVDPLGGMTIAQAIIDTATSGDNTIAAGVGGKIIYVLHWHLVANAAVSVRWKDSTPTNLTGAEPMAANGGVSAGDGTGVVLMTKAAGANLVLNLSAAVQVSGVVIYGVK